MWFGVAPPSTASASRKDAHPRLRRDKRFETEKQPEQPSPRRPRHQAHQSTTSASLSSRQHGDKTVSTPRSQVQKSTGEGERSHDDWGKKQTNKTITQHLQPEFGDEQSAEGREIGEELLQLMEGCQIGGGAVAVGDNALQQYPIQGSAEMNESGFRVRSDSRPGTGQKASLAKVAENQTDNGTAPVTPQLTSRSRRPSMHRATNSLQTGIGSFEDGNNSLSREWSTAPTPFVSLHPEHLVGHVASVCTLVVHDDRFIVSCSVDGSVKVWSQVTHACLHTIYGHHDVASCVDLNARWLVSGSHDTSLRVYDSTSRSFNLQHTLMGHSGHVTQVRLPTSLPGCILSCSDDYTLRLWNAELGHSIYELRAHHSRVTCFDVQPDHICSGAADGSVCFWDISSLSSNPEHSSDHYLSCVRIYYAHKATVQCIVDMTPSSATNSASSGRANSVSCSVVVTGSNDGTIQLFSAKTFAHLGRLDNVGSPVYAAVPLSNGRLLCSTKDGRLLLYGNVSRPTTRKTPAVLQLGTKWISSLLVCGDLVACSSEEVLYIVNTSRMCMVLAFETQHSFITCTRWIHKDALVTAGQDNVIKLWSIA